MEVGDDAGAAGPSTEEVEFAETIARYEEVLSNCKLLRSRLLLVSAYSSSSANQEMGSLIESLDKMEEQFHRLSIQEEMLKEVKVSNLALELVRREGPYDGLDEMLKEHCANQAELYSLANSIRSKKREQEEAICKLLDQFVQYSLTLKEDQVVLEQNLTADSDRTLQMKKSLEKQIKEIRFMQISISQIIANKNVDLRANDKIRKILEDSRKPITTLENFI